MDPVDFSPPSLPSRPGDAISLPQKGGGRERDDFAVAPLEWTIVVVVVVVVVPVLLVFVVVVCVCVKEARASDRWR